MSFWGELRRRNVFKVGAAYAVLGWLIIQVANNLFPPLGLPPWTQTLVAVLLLLGFPFALLLAWIYEITPEGIKRTAEVPREQSVRHLTSRRLNYVVTGLLVLAVAAIALDNVLRRPAGSASQLGCTADAPQPSSAAATGMEPRARRVSAIPGRLPNSVAVLPFDNLSDDPAHGYFARGTHEEVLKQLGKVESLNVTSRRSVERYATDRPPIPEIAAQLNVSAVMEGSVRYAGNCILVTVQLIDAATDSHVWAESYPGDLSDLSTIFALQADIAMNVANALRAELTPAELASIEQRPTDSREAYALYLRSLETQDRASAIDLLEQALAFDSEFALAHGALALIHAFALTNTNSAEAVPPDERSQVETLAREHAQTAIGIDPDVPEAHTALGLMAHFSWRWTDAERALKRAVEGAPSSPVACNVYGVLLSVLGRHAEAIALAERSLALNPGDPNACWYAFQLGYDGDYARAAAVFENALADQGTDLLYRGWLAFMEVALGDLDAAIEQVEIAERLAADERLISFLAGWAYTYSRAGRPEDAARIFEEIRGAADEGALPGAGGWALAYLAIGDRERALEWLEIAAEKAANHEPDEGFYNLLGLKMNVTNNPVLREPEFVDVLSRIRGD